MATVLKIKNTAIGGRKPTSAQIETAELAVNLADAKLYTKTASGQIIALGGSINSGATADRPNFPAVGDLFYDTNNAALYYYNGSAWVALSDGDDVDLGYTAAADKGTVTNTAGDDAELPVVDGTNAGLMAPADYTKLIGLSDIKTDSSPPGSPNANDIWIDTSECPPEIKVYTDCEGSGFEWISIGGGGLDVNFDLAMTGGDDVGDEKEAVVTNIFPAGLTPTYAWSVDGVVDGSATTSKRVNKDSDVGFAVKCTVSISEKVKEVTSPNVVKWPEFTFALEFTPANVLLGNTITVATNPDPVVGGNGLDATFVSRQWTKDGSAIGGETAATYTTRTGDDSATIGCTLVYQNSDGTGSDVTVSANYPGTISTAFIAQPTILSPEDGAGEGGDVSYYPETSAVDTVSTVPGGGVAAAAEDIDWNEVTYGNGKFVAVADTGTNRVMYSTDGISWTSASPAEDNGWLSVTYGDGKFVAVAKNGTNLAMYSSDGINWTSASAAEDNVWQSVTYGDDKFVAVANNGTNRVMYSADGINWTAASVTGDSNWRSVTYGDGKFVATANTGTNRVMYSADGISWTLASPPEDNQWWSVTYGADKFVAVAADGTNRVMYSTNGINWTSALAAEDNFWRSVTYGGDKFVAIAGSGNNLVMYSTDGINWYSTPTAENNSWRSVTYGDNKFVAVSSDGTNRVAYSFNGTKWDGDLTKLTLTNNKTFDSTDGTTERGTINSDLLSGALVTSDTAPAGTSAAFSTTLYTGDQDGEVIVNTGIDNTIKSMVWVKAREGSGFQHVIYDTVRGQDASGAYYYLSSSTTNSQGAAPDTGTGFREMTSTGFRLNKNAYWENGNEPYVAWNFRAAPGFMDVVTVPSEGIATDQIIKHNLGIEPGLIIVKPYDETGDWRVYHKSIGKDEFLSLNKSTSAKTASGCWGDVAPNKDEFRVKPNGFGWFTGNLVCYLFADNPTGGIKCGSYDGISSGTVAVTCGFEPGWLLIKSNSDGVDWVIFDNTRPANKYLNPNKSASEANDANHPVFDSNGFSIPWGSVNTTAPGNNYIYVAIAKDATAGNFPPTGIVSEAKDDDNTLTLTDVKGTWAAGMRATGGTELTSYGPDPAALEFVGSIPNGTGINTWSYACWEVDTDPAFPSPLKAEPLITDPTALQKLTPGTLALANDTQYYAQLKYKAFDPAVESNYSTSVSFKTKALQDGWTGVALTYNNQWESIAYGDNKYVAASRTDGSTAERIMWADDSDLDNWNFVVPSAVLPNYPIMTYTNNNKFVLMGYNSSNVYTASGSDLSTWQTITTTGLPGGTTNVLGITSGNGKVVVVGSNPNIAFADESDLSSWTVPTTLPSTNYRDIIFDGDRFIATGGNTSGERNGIAWADKDDLDTWYELDVLTSDAGECFGIAYGDNKYVLVVRANGASSPAKVFYCDKADFQNAWQSANLSENIAWYKVAFGNGRFVTTSTDGTNQIAVAQSSDLSSWAPVEAPSVSGWYSLIFGDKFVSVAYSGSTTYRVMYSESGEGPAATFLAYDADAGKTISDIGIVNRFGVDPTTNLNQFGIYDLTEQPTYPVQAYVVENNKYQPIKDHTVELASAQEEAAQANARLDAANAQLEAIKSDFEARITALEASD